MKRKLVITTVGTSFFNNNCFNCSEYKKVKYYYDYEDSDNPLRELQNSLEEENFNDCIDEINRCSNTDSFDSAEISVIRKLDLDRLNDKIILLPTCTILSFFAANAIKTVLEKEGFKDIEIKVLERVGSPKSKTFEQKGLPYFIDTVSSIIEKYLKLDYEIVLNPTGGYKSFFPFITILGLLYELRVVYLYEDSDTIINIPSLPIGYDTVKWQKVRNMLKVIEKIPQSCLDDYENKNKLSNFLELIGMMLNHYENERNKIEKSNLYDFFEKKREEIEKRFNRLYIKTKTYSLKYFLTDDLRPIFEKLSEMNYLIWKGDRVPEMVDHAERHHTNLFNIAEQILLPIIFLKKNLLTPEDIFILLTMIFVHDCGHVLGIIKHNNEYHKLFPNEIREFHHILGYERLKNFDDDFYLSRIFYESLELGSPKYLWETYLEAPVTIAMYHRKKMPLTKDDKEYNSCWFKTDIKPLEEIDLSFNGKKVDKDKQLLLASLFRIIDSLDCQVSRTGDKLEIAFHQQVLKNEVEIFERGLQKLRGYAKNKGIDLSLADDFIKKSVDSYRGKEGNSSGAGSDSSIIFDFRREFNENFGSDQFIVDYIEKCLISDFKKFQLEHYEKHSKIKEVLIDFDYDSNSKLKFIVSLKFFEKLEESDLISYIKDLSSEYNGTVSQILNKYNISFEYKV